jgi:hypothetical protein
MKDLTVGFIHGERWDAQFGVSLLKLLAAYPTISVLPIQSGPAIDKGRNYLVDQFLDGPREWLLMVDSDMTFSPDDVARVYHHRDQDLIVGGLPVSSDGIPTARKRLEDGKFHAVIPTPKCVEVDYVGAAFMFAHRSVYEKVRAEGFVRPYFAFTDDHGEDAEFCYRARALGYRVVADGMIRPGHRKTMTLALPPVKE